MTTVDKIKNLVENEAKFRWVLIKARYHVSVTTRIDQPFEENAHAYRVITYSPALFFIPIVNVKPFKFRIRKNWLHLVNANSTSSITLREYEIYNASSTSVARLDILHEKQTQMQQL